MTVTIKDEYNVIPKLVGESNALDGTTVTAGIHGADDSERARIARKHEFGIGVPKRAFLRPAMDNNEREIRQMVNAAINAMVRKRKTADEVVNMIGLYLRTIIDQQILSGDFPPLAPSTIEAKGSTRPLIDTGLMRQLITFKVDGQDR